MQKAVNGNPVCARTYFWIEGELASPLLIGSGENDWADMDVMTDSRGVPFIPGSSLAGALRHYLTTVNTSAVGKTNQNGNIIDYLFGSRDGSQSHLYVYDAELTAYQLSYRDGVKLNEFKTAQAKGKYEMQIVERGAKFVIRLEWIKRENDSCYEADVMPYIRQMVMGLHQGEITFGAKSRRGFGRMTVKSVLEKTFRMEDKTEHQAWLDWDWQRPDAFQQEVPWNLTAMLKDWVPQDHCLQIPLKVRNTIIIRRYTDKSWGMASYPDYVQLQSAGEGVIPGTSWMGAIRGRLRAILHEMQMDGAREKMDTIFGTLIDEKQNQPEKDVSTDEEQSQLSQTSSMDESKNGELKASVVRVEESILRGGHGLPITRNAIDRFTGGTVSGALYTSVPWVGGETELVLRWPRALKDMDSDALCGLLLWVIADLSDGLLAVGGETAVGRGTFSKRGEIRLDGESITEFAPYYKAAIEWCKQQRKEGGVNE